MNRRHAPVLAALLTALILGAVVLLGPGSGGGVSGQPGSSAPVSSGSTAAETGAPVSTGSAEVADIPAGEAVVDDDVAELTAEPVIGGSRTRDGAVEAFAESATWLIASPAAAEEPSTAAEAVSEVINDVDAEILSRFDRSGGADFEPLLGAYRVLAHAGPEEAPESVMVEVVAPLTAGGTTRWAIVGGVVTWTPSGWQIESIRPQETGQPASPTAAVLEFSDNDRASVLPGVGWQFFANSSQVEE